MDRMGSHSKSACERQWVAATPGSAQHPAWNGDGRWGSRNCWFWARP